VPRDDDRVQADRVPELSGRLVVLAGPGVVDAGAIAALRAFAEAGDLGVANTWGAKGVFAWDSPHHLGTCGLQSRDFELLGFDDAEAIVAVGLDEDESPRSRVARAPIVDLAPTALRAATGRVVRTGAPLPNELYPTLAAIAQPGYIDERVPLHPARTVAELSAALPEGGLLVAQPGLAGLWVARTFSTPALTPGAPRRVRVPARRDPAAVLRQAVTAADAGRVTLLVTMAPLDAATRAVLDATADAPRPLVVVAWSADGPRRSPAEFAAALRAAVDGGPALVETAVDIAETDRLVDAAGAVVAWGGL